MRFLTKELDSPLAVISPNMPQDFMVSKWPLHYCTIDPKNAKYQDCDGKWIPIRNADQKFSYSAVWLQVIKQNRDKVIGGSEMRVDMNL